MNIFLSKKATVRSPPVTVTMKLTVDLILKSLTSLESRCLGSLDVHGCTRSRVSTLTSGSLSNIKCSEADQLNLIILSKCISDGIKYGLNSCICILLGKVCALCNGCY